MIRVGVTGQPGFIGTHLFNTLGLHEGIKRIPCKDEFFESIEDLKGFVSCCDVIVHLAGMNRHQDPQMIYKTNLRLTQQLVTAMEETEAKPQVIFSSSTQEERDNPYGRSKMQAREILAEWAEKANASFSGLVIPNVFGPFGRPYYNSFVATFCHQLAHDENPRIDEDNPVDLIYVGSLCRIILDRIFSNAEKNVLLRENEARIPYDFSRSVSEILDLLRYYRDDYLHHGIIPKLANKDDVNLFNTFRSYMEIGKSFPVDLKSHSDTRGSFVEVMRLGIGGQVSFSTTLPGITRGNHFHTRKIERFVVIKGKARIQLRRIGDPEVFSFDLVGSEPGYVDMPIWYTHNITNIGEEDLYTMFWINEFYDSKDPDTYFEKV